MIISNVTRQTVIAKDARLADTPLKRLIGLLGKKSLAPNEALIIKPCNSIHMFFMKFPIDVIFLDGENHAVGIVENIKPFQLSPLFWQARLAIELPIGAIKQSATQRGDIVRITKTQETITKQ